ncbi:hypothetical protein B0T22DRAFT_440710 [Podospora appendiculata]|uniref:DUF3295 domain-containing protein n=1 Tax=Podospora appendiculata TaxID=314037 RepID=A0AAE1CD43_9PEZI|nr:hypothetical protein B0T22DRAFT_440710 [Podospora appendiculata]
MPPLPPDFPRQPIVTRGFVPSKGPDIPALPKPSSSQEKKLFQRVDPTTNLPKRQSLVTLMLMKDTKSSRAAQSITIPTNTTRHQAGLSPQTTRRNMLTTELPESLRRDLLWERSQNDPASLKQSPKRVHRSEDSYIYVPDYHSRGW